MLNVDSYQLKGLEMAMSTGLDHDRSVLRPLTPDDRQSLLDLDRRMSDRSIYLRFFILSRHAADVYIDELLKPDSPDHISIAATVDGQIVGVASYQRTEPTAAEVALMIDDAHQHRGIGTLLLEHLAAQARRTGIGTFDADVLNQNTTMLGAFRSLGLAIASRADGGTVRLSIDLGEGPDVMGHLAVDSAGRVDPHANECRPTDPVRVNT